MKAIVQQRYGSADVLALRDIQAPVPGRGEVLVRVRAAGVHAGDWHLMTGTPRAIRLGSGLVKPRSPVRGTELAGVVEATGPGVSALKPGDEVFGVGRGAFAELAVAKADKLVLKPAELDFVAAAALAESGTTALRAVRDKGEVRSGQRVLVLGAGGGVGSFAVQLARHYGATVTGVGSSSKVEFIRSLGAAEVVDYTKADFTGVYDVIVDCGGLRPLPRLREALTPDGTLVLVGGEGGGGILGGALGRTVKAQLLGRSGGRRLRPLLSLGTGKDFEDLRELAVAGALRPAVDRTYPLAEAALAMRAWERRDVRGKVVITP